MTKVEVFQFDYKGGLTDGKPSNKTIKDAINNFVESESAKIISINTNVIDRKSHNNGGYNWNTLVYTIVYEVAE